MEIISFLNYIKMPLTVVHVITVVVGMGSALVSDILFNFYAKDKKLDNTEKKTLEILSKVVWWSLLLIIISGIIIFFTNTGKYMGSDKFLAKMTILAVLLLNGTMLNFRVWPHVLGKGFFTSKKEITTRRLAFFGGAVSVVSWISVCALGVFDTSPTSYGNLMALYILIVSIAGFIALFMEIRMFEK